jgi:hypothetical protein
MIFTVQMLAGLAVAIGGLDAMLTGKWKPLFQLALPGLAIWLLLGWATGWATPD